MNKFSFFQIRELETEVKLRELEMYMNKESSLVEICRSCRSNNNNKSKN